MCVCVTRGWGWCCKSEFDILSVTIMLVWFIKFKIFSAFALCPQYYLLK